MLNYLILSTDLTSLSSRFIALYAKKINIKAITGNKEEKRNDIDVWGEGIALKLLRTIKLHDIKANAKDKMDTFICFSLFLYRNMVRIDKNALDNKNIVNIIADLGYTIFDK